MSGDGGGPLGFIGGALQRVGETVGTLFGAGPRPSIPDVSPPTLVTSPAESDDPLVQQEAERRRRRTRQAAATRASTRGGTLRTGGRGDQLGSVSQTPGQTLLGR